MNSYSIIKSFYILEYQSVCMTIIENLKSVQPFSFYQCMKGFDTCIIPWISFLRITSLDPFCFYELSVSEDCLMEGILNDGFLLVIIESGSQQEPGMVIDCRGKIGLYPGAVFPDWKFRAVRYCTMALAVNFP